MLLPTSKKELKDMVEHATRIAKDKDRVLKCPRCGSPMMLTLSDYEKGKTVIHNTPLFGCCVCDGTLINLDIAALIEEVVERTALQEFDFREIGKLVESFSE